MHIRQLLAAAALLLVGANSMPQPQDLAPTATAETPATVPSQTGGFGGSSSVGIPTGVSTGSSHGGDTKEEWNDYTGGHDGRHGFGGPGGFGLSSGAESTFPSPTGGFGGSGGGPSGTADITFPTYTGSPSDGSGVVSSSAAAAAPTGSSGKLRRARAL